MLFRKLQNTQLIFIIIATLLFLIAIAFDISAYLRGPAPYPPEWRWDYLYVNTLQKIYVPIIISSLIIAFYLYASNKSRLVKEHVVIFLSVAILLSFALQIGIQYFSRAGVGVLIHRIINPDLNGYYSASLTFDDPVEFLSNFNENILKYNYHAASHPPGAILIFYVIKKTVSVFPFLASLASSLSPSHSDVNAMWKVLKPLQKATAIVSAFLIPLLSTLTIIPLFYLAKNLYSTRTAIKSVFLYIFIPSIVLFIPINDSFLPFFSTLSAMFFILADKKKNKMYFFFSGITLFLGAFFSLSLIPMGIFLSVYYILSKLKKERVKIKEAIFDGFIFILGFTALPIILYIFAGFNFIQMIKIIVDTVPHIHTRSYTTWIFYNLYDFFVFTGIPITAIFLIKFKQQFKEITYKSWKHIDIIFIAFLALLLFTNFSGSIRGEAGRILSIYMPLITLVAADTTAKILKLKRGQFVIILVLMAIQIVVMQEFWVLLW